MDLFSSGLDLKTLKDLLGPNLLTYLIVAHVFLKPFKDSFKKLESSSERLENHFKIIETSMSGIKDELKDFKQTFNYHQRGIDKRVSNLEAYNEANTYEIGELKRSIRPREG